jgi:ribonuclease P protein component
MNKNTFGKAERLNKKHIIETMFAGKAKSFAIFPLRVLFIPLDSLAVPATILISVSRKRFKRAVERNRVKRQIRETYRKNKYKLLCALEEKERKIAIAFIYLDNKLIPSAEMEKKMKSSLTRCMDILIKEENTI